MVSKIKLTLNKWFGQEIEKREKQYGALSIYIEFERPCWNSCQIIKFFSFFAKTYIIYVF